jgi:hypothetical protein
MKAGGLKRRNSRANLTSDPSGVIPFLGFFSPHHMPDEKSPMENSSPKRSRNPDLKEAIPSKQFITQFTDKVANKTTSLIWSPRGQYSIVNTDSEPTTMIAMPRPSPLPRRGSLSKTRMPDSSPTIKRSLNDTPDQTDIMEVLWLKKSIRKA